MVLYRTTQLKSQELMELSQNNPPKFFFYVTSDGYMNMKLDWCTSPHFSGASGKTGNNPLFLWYMYIHATEK